MQNSNTYEILEAHHFGMSLKNVWKLFYSQITKWDIYPIDKHVTGARNAMENPRG